MFSTTFAPRGRKNHDQNRHYGIWNRGFRRRRGAAEECRQHRRKAGKPIEIEKILDLREFPDSPFADRFTKDFTEIESDPGIAIVVETMGGLNPAYDFVKRSLLAGKSVVTSNKELVAAKGDELLAIAGTGT